MIDLTLTLNGKEKAVHELLREMYSLTKSQIILMYLLAKEGRPLTVDEISKMVSMGRPSLRNALNDLAYKGLVHKMTYTANKKKYMYYVVKEEVINKIKKDYENSLLLQTGCE